MPVRTSLLHGNTARSTREVPSRPPASLTGVKCPAKGACSDTTPSLDPDIESTSTRCLATARIPCLWPLMVTKGCGRCELLSALRSHTFSVESCKRQEVSQNHRYVNHTAITPRWFGRYKSPAQNLTFWANGARLCAGGDNQAVLAHFEVVFLHSTDVYAPWSI